MKKSNCLGLPKKPSFHERELKNLLVLILAETGLSVEKNGWPGAVAEAKRIMNPDHRVNF